MDNIYSVKALFSDKGLINTKVTVRGWVKNRRDSKAGFSFLTIYDGSCFYPIQAVLNNTLANYNTEVLHLTKDCSVTVSGVLVALTGKGQSVEIQADTIEVHG